MPPRAVVHGPGRAVRVRWDAGQQTTAAPTQERVPGSVADATGLTDGTPHVDKVPSHAALDHLIGSPPSPMTSVGSSMTPSTAALVLARWREEVGRYALLRHVPLQCMQEQRYDSPHAPDLAAHARSTSSPPTCTHGATDFDHQLSTWQPARLDLATSYETSQSLRALLWGGCRPDFLRATLWRVLCDYAPATLKRQRPELARKRALYCTYTTTYYAADDDVLSNHTGDSVGCVTRTQAGHSTRAPNEMRSRTFYHTPAASPVQGGVKSGWVESERAMYNQIALDLPRHAAALFHCPRTAASLARCLFLWAQRHPVVGYVQGMDDLVSVFYALFLTEALVQQAMEKTATESGSICALDEAVAGPTLTNVELAVTCASLATLQTRLALQAHTNTATLDAMSRDALDAAVRALPATYLVQVEADTFWCADRLLAQMQDSYAPGMPGITRGAAQLESLLRCAGAAALLDALAAQGVTVVNGCFQWLHCLLARELPRALLLPLWDTYFAMGGDVWPRFHLCVCAALLLSLRTPLSAATTETMLQLLRHPFAASLAEVTPTAAKHEAQWLELLIADAYRLWRLYPDAVRG